MAPEFVEWMMGFPEGWVAGMAEKKALKALGNAVQPQVAEAVGRLFLDEFVRRAA